MTTTNERRHWSAHGQARQSQHARAAHAWRSRTSLMRCARGRYVGVRRAGRVRYGSRAGRTRGVTDWAAWGCCAAGARRVGRELLLWPYQPGNPSDSHAAVDGRCAAGTLPSVILRRGAGSSRSPDPIPDRYSDPHPHSPIRPHSQAGRYPQSQGQRARDDDLFGHCRECSGTSGRHWVVGIRMGGWLLAAGPWPVRRCRCSASRLARPVGL